MTLKTQKRPAHDAPADKYFWVCNGLCLKNFKDLADALAKMPSNIFNYHVNKGRNDFAKWVADVFGDSKLAGEIAKAKTSLGMSKKVRSKI